MRPFFALAAASFLFACSDAEPRVAQGTNGGDAPAAGQPGLSSGGISGILGDSGSGGILTSGGTGGLGSVGQGGLSGSAGSASGSGGSSGNAGVAGVGGAPLEPPAGMVPLFVGVGYGTRTVVSCDF